MYGPGSFAGQLDGVSAAPADGGSPPEQPERLEQPAAPSPPQGPPLLGRLSSLQDLLSRDIENDVLRSLPFADGAATVDEHDQPLLRIRRLPGTDGGFEVHVQHHFRAHFDAPPASTHDSRRGPGSPLRGLLPAGGGTQHGEERASGSAGGATTTAALPFRLDYQHSSSSEGGPHSRPLSTLASEPSGTPITLAARHARRPSCGSGGTPVQGEGRRGGAAAGTPRWAEAGLPGDDVGRQPGTRVARAQQHAQQHEQQHAQQHEQRHEQQQPHQTGPASFEVDPREVVIGERIAVGGFAEVFVGRYQGTLVAVKLLLAVDEEGQQRFRREVQLLESIRHPNIVLFMGWCWRPHLAILSEFMHRGSLWALLRRGGNQPLEPRMQRSVAVSVARGMAYLHGRTPVLLHLDLKSPNILVNDRWQVKIADFGLSRVRSHTLVSGTGAGTPEWMSPEVLRSEGCDERADVYSYGVVLWECLTGLLPWQGLHPMQVVGAVGFQGRSLQLPHDADPFLAGLCRRCMAQEPRQRPLFPQIVQELAAHFDMAGAMSSRQTLSDGGLVLERSEADTAAPREPPLVAAAPTMPALPQLRLPLGKACRRAVAGGAPGGACEAAGGEEAPADHDSFPFGLAPEEGALDAGAPGAAAAGMPSPFADAAQQTAAPSTAMLHAGTAAAAGALAGRLHSQMSLTNASPFAQLSICESAPGEGEGAAWRGGLARLHSARPPSAGVRQGSGLTTLHQHMERSASIPAAAVSLQSQPCGVPQQTSIGSVAAAPACPARAEPEQAGCAGNSGSTLPTASSPLDPPSFASVADAAAWRRPSTEKP